MRCYMSELHGLPPPLPSSPPPPLPSTHPNLQRINSSEVGSTAPAKSQGLAFRAKERVSKVFNDFKTSVHSISPKQSLNKLVRFVTTISPPSIRRNQHEALTSDPLTSSRMSISSPRSLNSLESAQSIQSPKARGSTNELATRYEKEVNEKMAALSSETPKKTDKEIAKHLQEFVRDKLESDGYSSKTGQTTREKAASILDKILTDQIVVKDQVVTNPEMKKMAFYNALFIKGAAPEEIVKKYSEMNATPEYKSLMINFTLDNFSVDNYVKLDKRNETSQGADFTDIQKNFDNTCLYSGMATVLPSESMLPVQEKLDVISQEKQNLLVEKGKIQQEIEKNNKQKEALQSENETLKKEKTKLMYRTDGILKAGAIGQTIKRNEFKINFYNQENAKLNALLAENEGKQKQNKIDQYIQRHHLFIAEFNDKNSKIYKLNKIVTELNDRGIVGFNTSANNNPSNILAVQGVYMNDSPALYKITVINAHYVNDAAKKQITLNGAVYNSHTNNLDQVFDYQFQTHVHEKENLHVLENGLNTEEVLSILENNNGTVPPDLAKNYSAKNIEEAQAFYTEGITSKALSDVNTRIVKNLLSKTPDELKTAIQEGGPKLNARLLNVFNTTEGLALLENPATLNGVSEAYTTSSNIEILNQALPSIAGDKIIANFKTIKSPSELKTLVGARQLHVNTILVENLIQAHLEPIPNESEDQRLARNAEFQFHLEEILKSHSRLDVGGLIRSYQQNPSTQNIEESLRQTTPPLAPSRPAPFHPTRPRR